MEECQKKGKTKAIGVSNFSQAEMERLVKEANIVSHGPTLVQKKPSLTFYVCVGASSTSIRYVIIKVGCAGPWPSISRSASGVPQAHRFQALYNQI